MRSIIINIVISRSIIVSVKSSLLNQAEENAAKHEHQLEEDEEEIEIRSRASQDLDNQLLLFLRGFDVWIRRSAFQRLISAYILCIYDDNVRFSYCLDPSLSRLHRSRGCLGCCTKPTPIIAVDEPSKGLKIQGRTVQKPSISEDFWSTSTCDIDNSAVQSQRSISSISTSNQTLNHYSGTGSTSSHSEFINHGLLLWNQTRLQWAGSRSDENRSNQIREPRISWNATYENLLGTSRAFSRPVPLSEMIEFLVDIWEQEGMYD